MATALIATACGDSDEAATSTTTTTVAAAATDATGNDVTVTETAASTSEAPATSTTVAPPPTTLLAVERVDWANLTYAAECGIVDMLELADGEFRPEQYNSNVESLIVTFTSAEAVPTRPDDVLVRLSCAAGGPTGGLAAELFFIMTVGADGTAEQRLVVVAEPDAIHSINDEGVVVIDDTTYGSNDPNCCPSVFRSRQIVWDDGVPTLIEGSLPDGSGAPADPAANGCVASELEVGWPNADEVTLFEQALQSSGFEPGPVDGVLDDATISATVRLIEFNADNPALHSEPGAPYTNIHAEAREGGIVRAPVFAVLGIACDTVTSLPPR